MFNDFIEEKNQKMASSSFDPSLYTFERSKRVKNIPSYVETSEDDGDDHYDDGDGDYDEDFQPATKRTKRTHHQLYQHQQQQDEEDSDEFTDNKMIDDEESVEQAVGYKPCVICAKPASKKNYTTKLYMEYYRACFPSYNGKVGLVCSTCYNKCYVMRKDGGKNSTSSVNNNGNSNNNNSTTITPTKKTRVKKPSSASKTENMPCACCGDEHSKKLYVYDTFASDYSELFPDIPTPVPGAKVCILCYQKGKKLREKRAQMKYKQVNHTEDQIEERDTDHAASSIVIDGVTPIDTTTSLIVDIFLDFRMPDNTATNGIPPGYRQSHIIRVDVSAQTLISDLKTVIQSHISQLYQDNTVELKQLRRVSRDYHGYEVQQCLWTDDILQKYPLDPMERIVVYLAEAT
jgi:hypothetical protein